VCERGHDSTRVAFLSYAAQRQVSAIARTEPRAQPAQIPVPTFIYRGVSTNSIRFTNLPQSRRSNSVRKTNGTLYVPRIKNEENIYKSNKVDWKKIEGRSQKLIETEPHKIRNRTLKQFVYYAQQSNLNMKMSSIVYVVIYPRTRQYYIGRTSKDCITRLKAHHGKRNATHHSELSQFMRIVPESMSNIFIFPIYQHMNPSAIAKEELAFIDKYSHQKRSMLNRNEKFTRTRRKNRQRIAEPKTQIHETLHPQKARTPPVIRPQPISKANRVKLYFDESIDKAKEYLRTLSKRNLRFIHEVAHESVIPIIKEETENRYRIRRNTQKYVIRIPYCRRLRNSQMADILRGCPFSQDTLKDTKIVVGFNGTLGSFACNASKLCITQSESEPPCFCEGLRKLNIPEECFRNGHFASDAVQHVLQFLDIDPADKVFEELQVLWFQGAKFRSALCLDTAYAKLETVLQTYINNVLDDMPIHQAHNFSKESLVAWQREALQRYIHQAKDDRNYIISLKTRKTIIEMAKKFVITTVDKNAQGMAILCMKDYLRRLEHHVNSPTYERTTKTAVDIINEHRTTNRKFNCKTTPALPFIKIIPKLHKEPARPYDRYIAGLSHFNRIDPLSNERLGLPSSSLHILSRKVSDFLNAIIDILILQDKKLIQKGQPKRVWIIRDTAEVIHVLRDASSLFTHDFSTMYTNFPLEALYSAIEKQVKKATSFLATSYFHSTADNFVNVVFMKPSKQSTAKALWRLGAPNPQKDWGTLECLEALSFLLHNSYYSNRFGIVRQIVGLAMGSPHSPPAATIGLSAPEADYVDRVLAQKGPVYVKVHLRNFKAYTRYIDDMGTESTEIPTKTDYFNMDVIRTASCPPEPSVDLLAYKFTKAPHGMLVSFKDKQANFPVLLIRYPGHISTITESCKIGSVVAGLVSIYRVIDSPTLFRDGLWEFFDVLKARRFTYTTIRQGITKFLRRNCRREYIGFLLHHFFLDILLQWPHRTDVPASRAVELAMLRHTLRLDAPRSWRERAPDRILQEPSSTIPPSSRLANDLIELQVPIFTGTICPFIGSLHHPIPQNQQLQVVQQSERRVEEDHESRSSSSFYSIESN
jgi:hypothetical protein